MHLGAVALPSATSLAPVDPAPVSHEYAHLGIVYVVFDRIEFDVCGATRTPVLVVLDLWVAVDYHCDQLLHEQVRLWLLSLFMFCMFVFF